MNEATTPEVMVFVIQNSQNRDSQAVEAKLDEIMRALDGADDQLLTGLEDLPEKKIRELLINTSTILKFISRFDRRRYSYLRRFWRP